MEALWTGGIAALALVNVAYLVVLLAVLRQVGVLLIRLGPTTARAASAGPAVGDSLEPIALTDVRGAVILIGPTKHESTLLVFVSPRCDACRQLLPSLGPFSRQYRDLARIVTISTIDEATTPDDEILRAVGPNVALVRSRSFAERLGITLTPYAIVLGPDGGVRSKGIANNLEQLESLLNLEEFRPTGLAPLARIVHTGGEK